MAKQITSELDEFIKSAVKAGSSYDKIKAALREAGWADAQINNALKFYHTEKLGAKFPVAVPKPKEIASPRLGALNFFYFLAFYATLCSVTFAIFTILDFYLPDGHGRMAGAFYEPDLREGLQTYLSIIMVAAPVTLFAGHLVRKAIAQSGQSASHIRLKLIYLSFLIGAVILLICGVLFVNYFIDGVLSYRFGIKVALLTIKFAAVYYYFKPELYKSEGA